jgi:prohibitin 2
MNGIPRIPKLPIGAIVGGLGAAGIVLGSGSLLFNSIYSVKPGERAIIFNRLSGVKQMTTGEGTHVVIPWFEWPIIVDVRTRPTSIKSVTGTRDLQMVDVGLRVLTRPDQNQLPRIYRRLGINFDEKVLPSIVNETVKQVIAQFNATEMLTQREAVSRLIKEELSRRANEFDLVLEDVSITDLKFGKEFEKAVESKQVAQQDAERARFIVEKAMQDKKSIVIKAEGEAQSAAMIGKAIANNPGFVQLRRIDAAKEIAHSISESANIVYLPAESLLLNVGASNEGSSSGKK